MMDIFARLVRGATTGPKRAARPVLEPLEGRMLLYATTGDLFSSGARITWSLVPDGTALPGGSSNMFATLDAKFSQSTWIGYVQDAFAQWENVANVNFSQVGDNGAADNSGNIQQGSPNFGDIRIGMFNEGSGLAATTILPPKANGGSDSGDIFLNSQVNWQVGGNSGVDLETIALHEIGHALGLGHSTDPNAAMYANYNGVKEVPNSDDIAGVQSIWGPRQEDAVARNLANFSIGNAWDITPYISSTTRQVQVNPLDVAKTNESYWFKFTSPSNASGNMTVLAQANALSELSPAVQLYNANGAPIAQASAPAFSFGSNASITIGNMTPNTVYYVKTSGSNAGETGTGNYSLSINMGTSPQAPGPPPGIAVYTQADQGGGTINEQFGGANGTGAGSDTADLLRNGSVIARGDNYDLAPAATTASSVPVATTFISVPRPAVGFRGHRPAQAVEAIKKPA